MTDWGTIASACIGDIKSDEIAVVARVLDSLELAFRPLIQQLRDDTEPVLVLPEPAETEQ